MSGCFTYHTAPRGITCVLLLLLVSPALPYAAAQSGTDSSQEETYRLNANFNPSMAIIIVVLVCAFFIMGFFSIYVRRCAEGRADGSVRNAVGGDGRPRRGGARGLDLDVIGAFPIFVYSAVKDLKIGKGALECAVCLSEFEDDETLRLLPKCDHVFHPECIDAWLASHTTCPVCRANLSSDPGELAGGTAQQPDSNTDSDEDQNPRSELTEVQNQVSIYVGEDQSRDSQLLEMVNTSRTTPKQNRPPRSRGKFPRSHSTGHSLVQPGENCERYTLRLPEEVRKQMVMSEKQKLKLKRTTSCVVVLPREGSSRKGYWSGGEGSSRGKNYPDRWVFSMAPPFFTRTVSVRSPKVGGADGDATATTHPKTFLASVIGPLDCLAVRADGSQQSSARTPV